MTAFNRVVAGVGIVFLLSASSVSAQSAKSHPKPKTTEGLSIEQRVDALEKTLRTLQNELAALRAQIERSSVSHVAAAAPSLSREEARRLISQQLQLPAAETTRIPRIALNRAHSGSSQGGFMPTVTICQDLGTSWQQVRGRIEKLQATGLVVIGQKLQNSGKCVYEYMTIALTAQSLPYLLRNDDEGFLVRTHTLAFGEVSGIRMIEQPNIVEVEYTLLVQDLTPFAESVSRQPVLRSATFELFDDGWRIR